MMLFRSTVLATAALGALAVSTPAFACASCGCTFTSDWLAQGLVTQPGSAITIRYDWVPQTTLQAGTDKIDGANVPLPAEREVERRTENHYVTLAFDHQFASDWGVHVSLPWLTRPHSTVSEGDTDISRSDTNGIGDAQVMVRWQGLSTPKGVTGLQAGLVLPTGGFHQTFHSGPQAGEAVDRGLQPGTGTVQAQFGAYHYRRLGSSLALVAEAQARIALNSREDYRPGTQLNGSVGLQFLGWRGITPGLQINARHIARDSGAEADRDNSGGDFVALAPSATVPLGGGLSGFALVQVPLWQRVNGWQLTAPVIVSGGVQLRF